MKRKVKFAQYGIGQMGALMLRYTLEHGGELVAAFARNPNQIGKDAGDVAGIGRVGVPVSDSACAEEVLRETKPDICLIATKGSLVLLKDAFEACAHSGVNALTIGEQAAWPWTEEPEITAELDALAKEYGVTFAASGCPEISWGSLASVMAGACARVDRIKITGILNLDAFGKTVGDLFDAHGIGLTPDAFEEKFGAHNGLDQQDGHYPCYPGDQNGWLCKYLGLTPIRQTANHYPLIHSEDIYSNILERIIPAGILVGMNTVITTETEEGIIIEYEMAGKVYAPGDYDHYSITIYGEPEETTLILGNPDTAVFTCATPVNRIPDVINARPGYVTSEEFPANRFLFRPLNEYVGTMD